MRLLTHNMLSSQMIKGVKVGFPLRIEAVKVEVKPEEFDADFLLGLLPKLEYDALLEAARLLGHADGLPGELTEELLQSDTVLRALHHALLEVHVEEGMLICPETGRRFPVTHGIPNMLLNEDEV